MTEGGYDIFFIVPRKYELLMNAATEARGSHRSGQGLFGTKMPPTWVYTMQGGKKQHGFGDFLFFWVVCAYRVRCSLDRVYVHFFGTHQRNEPKKMCTRGSSPL